MQNKHIEHPEDSILTGDLSVLDWFITPGYLSAKMDGSVAIVWGIDPACGEFFVGTKAVFNKKKIRIAHSHEEIDTFYEGEVAQILHCCYDHLPRTETVYQADFIGFGGLCEYKPNTITYQFPDVVTQNIIIAPHTCYYAESDLRDAVAMPDRAIWNDTQHIKFVQPKAYILHDPWNKSESDVCFDDVEEVVKFARVMALAVNFVDHKKAAELKKQINACIRAGEEIKVEDFDCDPNLIGLWALVKTIKDDCLHLCRNDGPAAYMGSPYSGYERIDGEGYVFSNDVGTYKIVNREVFSYHNFNFGRFNGVSC
jgi:hypothetical protein